MLSAIDQAYCNALRIFNPYAAQKHRLDRSIPKLDLKAFKENPRYQFVYDKLFIAKSQGMACGTLEELLAAPKDAEYPLFIKPRYGHLSASSKDCYKIRAPEELQKYARKTHMMWSEFVNATEGMTDFVLINGEIVYQLSYVYSDAQNGFSDVWKLISPESTPPKASSTGSTNTWAATRGRSTSSTGRPRSSRSACASPAGACTWKVRTTRP